MATVPAYAVEAISDGKAIRQPTASQTSDWIYDGSLSPYDPRLGVLVNAHNEIVPFTVHDEGWTVSLGDVVSPSRPILFSAAVSWTSPTCALVAAGTAFGEIVVWQYHLAPEFPPRSEVLSVFTGHEGSIFGVGISPELELARGYKTRLLASCSDDRTVRIWGIPSDRDLTGTFDKTYMKSSGEARETGFGQDAGQDTTHTANTPGCLAVAMNHSARIWHVKFAGPQAGTGTPTNPIILYSFGEDLTAQKWELSLDGDSSGSRAEDAIFGSGARFRGSLKSTKKSINHIGKHIWSAAVTASDGSLPVIATGGADGKISLIGDWQAQERDVDLDISLSLQEVLESLPSRGSSATGTGPQSKAHSRDGFVRYTFLSEDRLLISTISGKLILGSIGKELSWAEVDASDAIREDLASYTVTKSPAPGIAVIGSENGRLYLFREGQEIRELATVDGKIRDLVCPPWPGPTAEAFNVAESSTRDETILTVLVTMHRATCSTLISVILTPESTTVERVPLPTERGTPTAIGICGELVIVGTRTGSITAYTRTPDGFVLQDTRHDCKSKDAVTSITTLPPLPGHVATSFLTTCRDGRYRIYDTYRGFGPGTSLQLLHEAPPSLGPLLEGAWFSQVPDGSLDLIIAGFRSTNFIIWNETKQHELAAVSCGSGHRAFDYVIDQRNAERVRFVYSRASQMGIYSQSSTPSRTLRQGTHGREIRTAAAHGKYLATGSEDTYIRIWEYLDEGSAARDMRCLAVLKKHLTGILCLKWLTGEYLLSSAGGEDLFIWRVTRLKTQYEGLAVVCEAVLSDRTPDADARITDFDVCGMPWGELGMIITLALSDSTLKTYCYTPQNGFTLLVEGQYTGACLTQARHLPLPDGAIGVLTSSTDGHIMIWSHKNSVTEDGGNDAGQYAPVTAVKIHQSSIKCLDMRYNAIEGGVSWQVITGGDDNALGICNVAWLEDQGAFEITNRSRVKDAHAAAITGAAIVEASETFTLVATASNDQRIKAWRIESPQMGGDRVALLDNQYSAIADAGDLEPLGQGGLAVVGAGMEVWDWSPRSMA